jgi:hypothetical protein
MLLGGECYENVYTWRRLNYLSFKVLKGRKCLLLNVVGWPWDTFLTIPVSDKPLSVRARIWRIRDGAQWHFSRAVWDIHINIYRDPLCGPHARQYWILWIFAGGDTLEPCCMQLVLTMKTYFIAVLMTLRLPSTAPASLNCKGGQWRELSWCTISFVEDILSAVIKIRSLLYGDR